MKAEFVVRLGNTWTEFEAANEHNRMGMALFRVWFRAIRKFEPAAPAVVWCNVGDAFQIIPLRHHQTVDGVDFRVGRIASLILLPNETTPSPATTRGA